MNAKAKGLNSPNTYYPPRFHKNSVLAQREPMLGCQVQKLVQEVLSVLIPTLTQVWEFVCEHFRLQKLSTFNDSPDLVEVEDQLNEVQCISVYIKLEDRDKLSCVVNHLEREALCLCEYTVLAKGEDNAIGKLFVDSFQEKYLGKSQFSRKVQEFMCNTRLT